MYRIDNATAIAIKPAKKDAGTQGYWTAGDPAQGIPATVMDGDWFNMVQGELDAILIAAGISPDKADDAQVATAIQAIIAAGGDGSSIGEDFYQPAHGLAKLNAVYHNGTIWVKGQSNTEATSTLEGVIDEVIDVDNFTVKYSGIIEWDDAGTPDFTVGNRVYLSNATAGGLVDVKPTYTIGEVDKLVGYSLPTGLLVAIDKGDIVAGVVEGTKSRLVKTLFTSGTLTINDSADDSIVAYLTSLEIKSGKYLVYAYGAGGGGGTDNLTAGAGGAGGGGGGVSRDILDITASTPFTIGLGGAGSTLANGAGNAGGSTTMLTVTSGGGLGGGTAGAAYAVGGQGGVGTLYKGQGGTNGGADYNGGGNGGGPSGTVGSTSLNAGLASGGCGDGANNAGDGGDGYIEIYEWEV